MNSQFIIVPQLALPLSSVFHSAFDLLLTSHCHRWRLICCLGQKNPMVLFQAEVYYNSLINQTSKLQQPLLILLLLPHLNAESPQFQGTKVLFLMWYAMNGTTLHKECSIYQQQSVGCWWFISIIIYLSAFLQTQPRPRCSAWCLWQRFHYFAAIWHLYKCTWEQVASVCVYCHSDRKWNKGVNRSALHEILPS